MSFRSVAAKNVVLRMVGLMTVAGAALVLVKRAAGCGCCGAHRKLDGDQRGIDVRHKWQVVESQNS